MNKFILTITILLFIVPANAQKTKEKDIVINLLVQFDKAITTKDSVTLKKILTDDFIGTIPNGESFNKNSFTKFHCNPQSKSREVKNESTKNWNIKITDDCAIVNRDVIYIYKSKEVKVKRLDICVKNKGKWFMASVQATEIL